MPELTPEHPVNFFASSVSAALQLDLTNGLVETADSRYLGAIGLSRKWPLFHSILGFNFSGTLPDSARFYLVPVTRAVEGRDGVVAVFRQFDRSKYQDFPEDLIAGWGSSEATSALTEAVAFMNGEVARLLVVKQAQARESGPNP